MNRPIKKDVNYSKNLVEYARKNIQKGYSIDSLRWALINQGHSRIEVDKALSTAQSEISRESVKSSQSQNQSQNSQQSNMQINVEPEKSWWQRFFG